MPNTFDRQAVMDALTTISEDSLPVVNYTMATIDYADIERRILAGREVNSSNLANAYSLNAGRWRDYYSRGHTGTSSGRDYINAASEDFEKYMNMFRDIPRNKGKPIKSPYGFKSFAESVK